MTVVSRGKATPVVAIVCVRVYLCQFGFRKVGSMEYLKLYEPKASTG